MHSEILLHYVLILQDVLTHQLQNIGYQLGGGEQGC
jgi:hypothetical protein